MGHINLEEVIYVDLEKLEAIMDWSDQNNVTDVICFMGLYSYYKRFFEGLPKVAHQITGHKNTNIINIILIMWIRFESTH